MLICPLNLKFAEIKGFSLGFSSSNSAGGTCMLRYFGARLDQDTTWRRCPNGREIYICLDSQRFRDGHYVQLAPGRSVPWVESQPIRRPRSEPLRRVIQFGSALWLIVENQQGESCREVLLLHQNKAKVIHDFLSLTIDLQKNWTQRYNSLVSRLQTASLSQTAPP